MILLTIALVGAICIAAIPQLRGPVTDYFGDKFGPKADITVKDPLAPCDFSAKPSSDANFTGPDFAEVGSNITLSYTNNDIAGISVAFPAYGKVIGSSPTEAKLENSSYIFKEPTSIGYQNKEWLVQGEYSITFQITNIIKSKYAPYNSSLQGSFNYINGGHWFGKAFYTYYNGVNIKLIPLDDKGNEITAEDHLFNKSKSDPSFISKSFKVKASYQGQHLPANSKINIYANLFDAIKDPNSLFYGADLTQMPYGEIVLDNNGEGTFDFSYGYNYGKGNANHSFTGTNQVDQKPNNSNVSYNSNHTRITFSQKTTSKDDLTYKGGIEFIALNADDCKKEPTRAKYYRGYYSIIKLNPVDPNDETKTKITAQADEKDKIKIKIDLKDSEGTALANQVEVYSSAGKLSISQDSANFNNYTSENTLKLSGTQREFYILYNKSEKITIFAKTLDQADEEITTSTEVAFIKLLAPEFYQTGNNPITKFSSITQDEYLKNLPLPEASDPIDESNNKDYQVKLPIYSTVSLNPDEDNYWNGASAKTGIKVVTINPDKTETELGRVPEENIYNYQHGYKQHFKGLKLGFTTQAENYDLTQSIQKTGRKLAVNLSNLKDNKLLLTGAPSYDATQLLTKRDQELTINLNNPQNNKFSLASISSSVRPPVDTGEEEPTETEQSNGFALLITLESFSQPIKLIPYTIIAKGDNNEEIYKEGEGVEIEFKNGPTISLCNKEYTECLPSQGDVDKIIAEPQTFPGDEVFIKYSIPAEGVARTNITANVVIPKESKFIPESNKKITAIDETHLTWTIDKIKKDEGYSARFSLKLDDSIDKNLKNLEVKADYIINGITNNSNLLKINLWTEVTGTINSPFVHPLSFVNVLLLDGESSNNEETDSNMIIKGQLYPSDPSQKPDESKYLQTNNKGKFDINIARKDIKNDSNTIKIRFDFWDSRPADQRVPILKFFYSNHQLSHGTTTAFEISDEKIAKKADDGKDFVINISRLPSKNKDRFSYPVQNSNPDDEINKEFPALAEIYYNYYLAYIKISAEDGDFNIQLTPKSVTVRRGFDEKDGIDYGSYQIKNDQIVLSEKALDMPVGRQPFYEYHALMHAVVEKIYDGKLAPSGIPDLILKLEKFKKHKTPSKLVWIPSGGYINDFTTDSLQESLVDFLSLELRDKVFGVSSPEVWGYDGVKFDATQPIANFDTANNHNEIQSITNLLYGLLHGVAQTDSSNIPYLSNLPRKPYKISFPENAMALKNFISFIKDQKPLTLYNVYYDLKNSAKIGQDGKNEVKLNYLDQLFIRHGVWYDRTGDWIFNPKIETIGLSCSRDEITINGINIGPRNWRK